MKIKIIFVLLLITALISSCAVRDLRTDYAKNTQEIADFEKGKRLLERSYLKMGYDNLDQTNNYEVKSLFDWKWPWTWMPMNALPGNKGKVIKFKFATNTFDGNILYTEGRKKGNVYGVQSWQSYELKDGKPLEQVKGKRRKWGLATYHYLIEAPMRILDAEIIKYAGETEFEGQMYDLVFATWGKEENHKEHDQYLIYINQKTGFTDLMQVTINDFFLPMPGNMKDATIRTERSDVDGIQLPNIVYIQLGTPKKTSKHVYKFSLYDWQFDHLSEDELYPINELEKVGDDKEKPF